MILKGNILITDNKDIIMKTLNMRPDIKLISLDEENSLGLDPSVVIPGTILLPPPEATIAEVDGNEQKYNMIYQAHLLSEPVKEYMSSILAFLYKGGKLLLYYPNSEYNNTMKNMLFFILILYGIHIGIIGDPSQDNATCYYDANLDNIQLDLIYYYTNILDWKEYLFNYPPNYPIPDQIMNILFKQINPYGNTFNEKLEVINRLRAGIKKNPYLINPIMEVV